MCIDMKSEDPMSEEEVVGGGVGNFHKIIQGGREGSSKPQMVCPRILNFSGG